MRLNLLHERVFDGRALKNLRLYYDPFAQNQVCVELVFVDGLVEYICIGSGKPEIVSCGSGHDIG